MFAAGKTSSGVDQVYSDDVFSTYLYTGNGATQTINNGLSLGSTAFWWAGKLKQGSNVGRGIATDSSGNVYVTGYATDAINYISISKYNTSGVIQWQRKLQQGNSVGLGIATDSSGNVYVTGYATDGANYISISKYNTSGIIQWQRKLQQGNSVGYGIATDSSGNVYVTGQANDGALYISISKYNTSGVIQWQRKLQQGTCYGYGIATDSSGNVYVTGYAQDGVNYYISISKYNTSGVIQWQRKLQQGASVGNGIATDSSGNVYVTGYAQDGVDYYTSISKYNTSGVIQWQRKLRQNISNGTGIATDSSGNVYVTGWDIEGGSYNASISKYNTYGVIQWQRKLKQNTSYGYGIATDSSGNVYVTGYANDGTNYVYIVKLAQDGSTIRGLANGLQMTVGTATDSVGTATDSAGTATDSAGTATDSAGTATDSAGTATYTYGEQTAATNNGLVWVKQRSAVSSHHLVDTVRGDALSINSDSTSQQTSNANGVTFNLDGFNVSTLSDVNANTNLFSSWSFRKSQRFFDVVTYTGTGTNRTIPHSLGRVPGMIVIKRTDSAADWSVYHSSFANTEYAVLNTTAAKATATTMWNSTTATSSVFSLGTNTTVNASAGTYVAYVFAHDTAPDGIIQCGSYVGNGITVGPTITLGWEPQFLIIKNVTGISDWQIVDVLRGLCVAQQFVVSGANTSAVESFGALLNRTPTGFKIASVSSTVNTASSTYIYLAIRRPNKTPTTGTQVFYPTAYTGTNVSNRLVNTTIAPDMVLVRQRNDAVLSGAVVADRMRGLNYLLTGSTAINTSSATAIDQQIVSTTEYGIGFSAMNGFFVGNDATAKLNVDTATNNHIVEAFKRAPGVFDIVYTGTTTNSTETHGLGVPPELIISKATAGASSLDWYVILPNIPAGGRLNYGFLNTTAAFIDGGTWTSTVTTFAPPITGGWTGVHYLFATKAGISKIFSYTGNGTSLTVDCGFSTGARFILIKRTDSTGDWYIWDSARGVVAANDPHLSLNSTAAEVTTDDSIDTNSTGFIVNQLAATNINVTSAKYIGLAYA